MHTGEELKTKQNSIYSRVTQDLQGHAPGCRYGAYRFCTAVHSLHSVHFVCLLLLLFFRIRELSVCICVCVCSCACVCMGNMGAYTANMGAYMLSRLCMVYIHIQHKRPIHIIQSDYSVWHCSTLFTTLFRYTHTHTHTHTHKYTNQQK